MLLFFVLPDLDFDLVVFDLTFLVISGGGVKGGGRGFAVEPAPSASGGDGGAAVSVPADGGGATSAAFEVAAAVVLESLEALDVLVWDVLFFLVPFFGEDGKDLI